MAEDQPPTNPVVTDEYVNLHIQNSDPVLARMIEYIQFGRLPPDDTRTHQEMR